MERSEVERVGGGSLAGGGEMESLVACGIAVYGA